MELKNDIFLRGENIYLRQLNEKDIEGNYRFWLNDGDIVKDNSHGRFPLSPQRLLSYINSAVESNDILVLAVVEKTHNEHIGNISLQNISWIDRNAEISFLLGEKNYWGKGVMHEAGILLIQHGFKTLNLHRIHCGTSSKNIGMQKLAEKLGMTQEGVRKEAIYKEGQYYDIIEYGILNPT